MSEPIFDVHQVGKLLGMEPYRVWRLVENGQLPRPVELPGSRLRGWKAADIMHSLVWRLPQDPHRVENVSD